MPGKTYATIDDLYRVPENGKAELIDGVLVRMAPTGGRPSRAAGWIFMNLVRHERRSGRGYAFPDNTGFIVDLPRRKSFSPDAAFYEGGPLDGKFLPGAPVFAAEVRSEGDYGRAAEKRIARKIADYHQAGTLVVWDVDVLRREVVRVHRRHDPGNPTEYRRGEKAEAEPALPGWTMPVDDLFE